MKHKYKHYTLYLIPCISYFIPYAPYFIRLLFYTLYFIQNSK